MAKFRRVETFEAYRWKGWSAPGGNDAKLTQYLQQVELGDERGMFCDGVPDRDLTYVNPGEWLAWSDAPNENYPTVYTHTEMTQEFEEAP